MQQPHDHASFALCIMHALSPCIACSDLIPQQLYNTPSADKYGMRCLPRNDLYYSMDLNPKKDGPVYSMYRQVSEPQSAVSDGYLPAVTAVQL